MAIRLGTESELVIAITGISIVLATFQNNAPNYADIRADQPGNMNTHKSIKHAAISSAALIGSVSLITRSPNVFIIGGATILFETWRYHFANHGAHGFQENAVAGANGYLNG